MPKDTESKKEKRKAATSGLHVERLTPVEITRRGTEPPSNASLVARSPGIPLRGKTRSTSHIEGDRTGTHLRPDHEHTSGHLSIADDWTGAHLKMSRENATEQLHVIERQTIHRINKDREQNTSRILKIPEDRTGIHPKAEMSGDLIHNARNHSGIQRKTKAQENHFDAFKKNNQETPTSSALNSTAQLKDSDSHETDSVAFSRADFLRNSNKKQKTRSILRKSKKEKEPVPINARPPILPPDPIEEKKKKRRIRRREQRSGFLGGLMYFLFVTCLSLCIAVFTWMAVNDLMSLNKGSYSATIVLPATEFRSEEITLTNESGSIIGTKEVSHANIDYICKELYNAGLVQYPWLFRFYCRISNADLKFSPGEYELKSSYDYRALVQNMRAGAGGVSTVTVTFPEGFTLFDIFQRFEEKKVAKASELWDAAQSAIFNFDFLTGTEAEGATRLEGYLYPDTYEFYIGMEPSSAISKLLSNFSYKYTADMITQTRNMGYSVADVIKIASIIEKEALLEDDRAYVASVIYNRLRAGMSLGMDCTILYLHQDYDGEPTVDMLNEDSPYNTHIYGGLPPTAICNPGMASISAALNPAESDFYYFYADKESGKLNFFSNYNDFTNYIYSVNG